MEDIMWNAMITWLTAEVKVPVELETMDIIVDLHCGELKYTA